LPAKKINKNGLKPFSRLSYLLYLKEQITPHQTSILTRQAWAGWRTAAPPENRLSGCR